MSKIRPFCGLRPLPELAQEITSLPYDVMNTEEARATIEQHPLSFLRVTRAEATMEPGTDFASPAVYQQAQANLEAYIREGQMRQDATPCYYIYRQQLGTHVQIGLAVTASVQEYRDGRIKKHELTRCDKEQDRIKHILTTQAQTGPVFLTYKSKGQISALILQIMGDKQPEYDFSADGVRHSLYVVAEPMLVNELTKLFELVDTMYIADGHHRCEAARKVADTLATEGLNLNKEQEYFLAVIFPDNMMKIMDYNRLVKDLQGMSEEQYLAELGKSFELEKLPGLKAPAKLHTFSMYLAGEWYLLTAKAGSFDAANPIASLDVSILQDKVLGPLLGIKEPRTDKRIDFVGGIRGLAALQQQVDQGKAAVAFAMYPTSLKELMTVADAGLIMPPKSTWFEPKLRDAMVVHMIGEKK